LTTQIVEKLDPEKAADILEEMAPDAAADLLADLPQETSEELLEERCQGKKRDEVRELLAFDEATAGGMMNPDFVFVGEASGRDEVLDWMREPGFEFRPSWIRSCCWGWRSGVYRHSPGSTIAAGFVGTRR